MPTHRWATSTIVATAVVLSALLVHSTSVTAECTGQPNRWPAFEEVAPTARQVVIGRVTSTNTGNEIDDSPVFTLEVEEVLRGTAPAVIEVSSLRSGLPLRGFPSCRRTATLNAQPDDRIALAIGGRIPSVRGRVNTAAWIEGSPKAVINPGLRRMELNEVRGVMGLRPLPSFEAIISGTSASIDGDSLLLEGVADVPFVSDWPRPRMGSWDIDSFVMGWDAATGLTPLRATLSLSTSDGGDRFELEVTAIEAVGEEALRFTLALPAGSIPTRSRASATLFLDIGADPHTWPAP